MTTTHNAIVTPNTDADQAANRPARLSRRQRVASAIASAVISGVLLGGVVYGITGTSPASVVTAGEAASAHRA